MRTLLLLCVFGASLWALPFSLIKKGEESPSTPSLLVIGGIHGNEPGSYFATAILSQYYTITKGSLWIVPNLNHASIQQNNRGIHGDMNRKFADLQPDDPDAGTVSAIKEIITRQEVGLILNLHDGHGFYRKHYLDTVFNPSAWGQTCVIDQSCLDTDHPFRNLDEIAAKVRTRLNDGLIEDHHLFDVRNTNTRLEDEAMRHSLTYFAITHHKPAFAIETSKNLSSLHHKVYYQLRAIECYMDLMGISYVRPFAFTPEGVRELLASNGHLVINNTFFLKLDDLKNSLSFVPLESKSNDFRFSHPLGSVLQKEKSVELYIGNRKITSLIPRYHEKERCSESVTIAVDGGMKQMPFATDFFINVDFKIINAEPDVRANVIGYTRKGRSDESNVRIRLDDLDSKYSVDTAGKSYRIEFYRQDRFCGMVLAHFK